jgi:hypothetical protein
MWAKIYVQIRLFLVAYFSGEKTQKKLPFGVAYFRSENQGNKSLFMSILPWKKNHENMQHPLIREKTWKYGILWWKFSWPPFWHSNAALDPQNPLVLDLQVVITTQEVPGCFGTKFMSWEACNNNTFFTFLAGLPTDRSTNSLYSKTLNYKDITLPSMSKLKIT